MWGTRSEVRVLRSIFDFGLFDFFWVVSCSSPSSLFLSFVFLCRSLLGCLCCCCWFVGWTVDSVELDVGRWDVGWNVGMLVGTLGGLLVCWFARLLLEVWMFVWTVGRMLERLMMMTDVGRLGV